MKSNQLRTLIAAGKPIVAPGVFDGLSARLVDLAGFQAIYASGGAIARAAGLPDLGILTLNEVAERIEKIVDATTRPVIADADTGFGGTANVYRTVRLFERIGVAALHLEDQQFPKRCGHLDGKSLVTADEMCLKLKVARDALGDDVVLIARTDAIAVEDFDAALYRARRYREAGADMIFVEAPESVEQIARIAREVPGPKLINMFHGGKTPLVPLAQLAALGYAIVIIPSDLQRAAIRAMQRVLSAIHQTGDSSAIAAELASFHEREVIVGTKRVLALDRR